jgi:hypothetical protein
VLEDDFSQHKTHQTKRILDLERDMTILRADIAELKNQDQGVRTEMNQIWQILIGNDDLAYSGLLDRVKEIERRPALAGRMTWLGMAATILTSLATLAAILFK